MDWMDDIDARIVEKHRKLLYENQKKKTGQPLMAKASDVSAIHEELCRHKLAIEVLTKLLIEKGIATPDELEAFSKMIDAEDGVIDGKRPLEPFTGRPKLVTEEPLPKKKMVIPKERPSDEA